MRGTRARALSSPSVELLTGLGFALAIYFAVEGGDTSQAQLLVAIMTIISFLAVFWLNWWSKNKIQVWKKGNGAHAESSHQQKTP